MSFRTILTEFRACIVSWEIVYGEERLLFCFKRSKRGWKVLMERGRQGESQLRFPQQLQRKARGKLWEKERVSLRVCIEVRENSVPKNVMARIRNILGGAILNPREDREAIGSSSGRQSWENLRILKCM